MWGNGSKAPTLALIGGDCQYTTERWLRGSQNRSRHGRHHLFRFMVSGNKPVPTSYTIPSFPKPTSILALFWFYNVECVSVFFHLSFYPHGLSNFVCSHLRVFSVLSYHPRSYCGLSKCIFKWATHLCWSHTVYISCPKFASISKAALLLYKISTVSILRFYRVLTMVYNTQNYWGFGLYPSSGF
jgi:hypothetical protein